MKALRASALDSDWYPRAISVRSARVCRPSRPSARGITEATLSTRGWASSGRTSSDPGSVAARSSAWTSSAQAAAGDQHQPLAVLRELVGELHRDPAAERVADDAGALNAESHQQVTDPRGVRAERVVTAGLGRLAVAEQVRRDDGVALGQQLDDLVPLRGAPRDPVNQHHGWSLTGDRELHAVAVQQDLDALDLRLDPARPGPGGRLAGSGVARSGLERLSCTPRYRFRRGEGGGSTGSRLEVDCRARTAATASACAAGD